MKLLIAFIPLVTLIYCGHVSHDDKATSYQNIHIEHFHAVPTYIKKHDKHLLEHPISLGKTSSKVQVHHGGKHDHGYAIADIQNDLHGHGLEFAGGEGEHHEHEALAGAALAGASVGEEDHAVQYEAQQEQGGEIDLGHYHQLAVAAQDQHQFTGHGLGHYQSLHETS